MKLINKLIPLLCLPAALQAQVQSSNGLKLVANGPLKIIFNEISLVNHGDLIPGNSAIIFTGSHSSSSIGGSRPVDLYNLIISKPAYELQLNNDLRVGGILTMEQGNLHLNNHLLDLGYTGSISGEKNTSRITGNNGGIIKAVAVLNAPRAFNPGNIGVEISSNANLGETIISRGHSAGLTAEGRQVIQRYYDIKPQHNTGLHASLKFYYLDAELNCNEGGLSFFSGKTQGIWYETGKDNMDAGNNWILKNGLDQLHRFTLAGAGNKLSLQPQGKTSAQLFPNPAHEQFIIMLNAAEEKLVALNLYDQAGRLLESKRVYCRVGMNTISWHFEKYPNGSYYVSFDDLHLKMMKIVKQ